LFDIQLIVVLPFGATAVAPAVTLAVGRATTVSVALLVVLPPWFEHVNENGYEPAVERLITAVLLLPVACEPAQPPLPIQLYDASSTELELQLRLELAPTEAVLGLKLKLLIEGGAGTTSILWLENDVEPSAPAQVIVYA
jgi:hypothetical protein